MASGGKRLKIEVPNPKEEAFRLGRVGVIAAVGFVLGVLWPWLAGVKLVPSPPESRSRHAAEEDEPAAATEKPVSTAPGTEPPPKAQERLEIGEPQVTSCRNAAGKTQRECDAPALHRMLQPHLLTLAACDGASGVEGVLSLGFDVDFARNRVENVRSGKSTDIPSARADALVECARRQLTTVEPNGVQHRYVEYTVFYVVTFVAPGTAGGDPSLGEVVSASGRATVGWHVALIRAEPPEGEVVARLLSGTQVVVTGRQGDWYRVKYDAKGREGWVFKSAIGL
jgi:hypothetical protein